MSKGAVCGGHGYNTAGKRTPPMPGTGRVIREWEFNHPTSRFLVEELTRNGYQMIHASDTLQDTALSVRANIANHFKADFYVSVHYNAENHLFDKYVDGVETLYYAGSVKGKQLAQAIQDELVKATGRRDRGIKARTDLGLLRLTSMPAVIIECGFMDNVAEASTMLDVGFQRLCAEAIARGINKFTGVVPAPPVPKEPTIKLQIVGKSVEIPGRMIDDINYIKIGDEEVRLSTVLQAVGLKVSWDNVNKVVIAE